MKHEPAAENGRSFLLTVELLKSSVIKVAILNDLRAPFGLHPSPTQQMARTEPPEANTGGGVKMEHFKVRHLCRAMDKELNQLGGIVN